MDLYSMPALGPESDALETQLMSMIDSTAAIALKRMREGASLSDNTRRDFAALLTTLLTRSPEAIETLKSRLEEWHRKDRPETQAIYEAFVWRPGMPKRAADQFAQTETPEEIQGFLAETLKAIFTHDRIIDHLTRMTWQVLAMPRGAPALLTGDQPIIMTNGLDAKDSYLFFPLGPYRMFLATHSRLFAGRLVRKLGMVKLARESNARVVERARRFVFAQDDSQSAFVSQNFGVKRVQNIGEKIAQNDPWGSNRPAGYSTQDAIADYVEWVRTNVEAGTIDV